MKRRQTIIIRNPQLRKIRNNLRSLIILACGEEQRKLQTKEENIISKPEYQEYRSPELLNQVKKLNEQYWEIERPLRASILICSGCFNSDRDMTYNPVHKEWYCIECYAKLKKGFSIEGRGREFP